MNPRWHRPLTATVVLLVLAAVWLLRIDEAALEQVDAGWKRALATVAAARALNAVISVAQGTELAVQPAGVGLTLTPGQVLDPVNQLVEQFSTLMLMATAAFGAQRVLIGIGAGWPLSLLISAAVLAWAVLRWRGPGQENLPPRWLGRALVLLLLLRFTVPLVALGSEAAFRLFMQDEYRQGQATLLQSSSELAQASGQLPGANTPPAGESLTDRMRRWWGQGPQIGPRFEALKDQANRAVEQVVRLIVVFMLQTLVLPWVSKK